MDEVAFGRYRLIAVIGSGGMGKVYKAHDTLIDRDVAIKVLAPEMASRPGYSQRFRREASTAARLTEPHIIPVHDTGEIDGQLYLVMPVIDGIDLRTLLRRDGPMSPDRAVRVIEQLAEALGAAHAAGLVHRDIKPSNALVTGDDFVYLIDFGIAHDAKASRLTSTGRMVGTLAYMAPERFSSGTADARADVYALACVLYECLTGATPFRGGSMEQQIAGHLTLDPPRPSEHRPGVPAGLDGVIAAGMAKNPDQRYQSAHELATAARRALTVPDQRPTLPAAPRQPPPEPPARPVPAPAFAYETPPPPPPSPWAPTAQLRPESPTYQAPRLGSPAPQDQRRIPAIPPSPGPPTPARAGRVSQRTIALVAGVIGLVVVVLAGVGITSYLLRQPATNSQPSTTRTTVPAVAEGALDGLLLSADQINSAMGATEMGLTRTLTTTYDDSPVVADKACLPLANGAQSAVYTGSGLTAVRNRELRDQPFGKWTHLVDQIVVLFPSADGADAFFTASTRQWPACSNRQYNVTTAGKPDQVETVGPVSNANGTLSATETAGGGNSSWTWDWDTCQRALTVANNVAIDVRACSKNRSDSQSDAGVNIARQIAAKVPTK